MSSDPTADDERLPSQVREKILAEHAKLRTRIGELRAVLDEVGDAAASTRDDLRRSVLDLLTALEAHIDHEDEVLLPTLRTIDAWGEERARRLGAEHAEQRTWIAEQRAKIGAGPIRVAAVRAFLDRLEKDMEVEEASSLSPDLLTEYPFPVDLGGA
ncbi:MAG: hemerythrin domain-containing protein [Sandaracinaceae bacterium]